jgi:hypothetical protein
MSKIANHSRVKNITSAPRHINASAARIPTEGDHAADRTTKERSARRVRGIAYNSTTTEG